MEGISILRGNSKTIECIVPDCVYGASGYTSDFLVAYGEDNFSGTTLIQITGNTITADYLTVFSILPEMTESLPERTYFYQIDIVRPNERVTILADTFTVLPAITY